MKTTLEPRGLAAANRCHFARQRLPGYGFGVARTSATVLIGVILAGFVLAACGGGQTQAERNVCSERGIPPSSDECARYVERLRFQTECLQRPNTAACRSDSQQRQRRTDEAWQLDDLDLEEHVSDELGRQGANCTEPDASGLEVCNNSVECPEGSYRRGDKVICDVNGVALVVKIGQGDTPTITLDAP